VHHIDCSKEDHVQFIRTCKNIQFPNYHTLTISELGSLDENGKESLRQFLVNSAPEQLKEFYFYGEEDSIATMSEFNHSLQAFVERVEDHVAFCFLQVSSEDLANLLGSITLG
jgi:hypothetical protein